MPSSVNSVVLVGRLTRDPDVRSIPSGTTVCELGLAVDERFKNGQTGEWEDRANFFDITVWGAQGDACGKYLSKGRQIAVQGRLRWESWEKDGQKRSKVRVIADTVQFLSDGQGNRGGGGDDGSGYRLNSSQAEDDLPADTADFKLPDSSAADDDIPF